MGLERRNCDGPCVLYSVTVSGDGKVDFNGGPGMLTPGHHRSRISAEAVRNLLHSFQQARYFELSTAYHYPITDAQGAKTWIEVNGRSKSVDDYAPGLAGTPAALRELEQSFDNIAQTNKWVKGNVDTLPSLIEERWNFQSQSEDNLQLYRNAMVSGLPELIDCILRQPNPGPKLLYAALEGATSAGDISLVRQLIRRGANPFSPPRVPYGRPLLMTAVASGNPDMVKETLRYTQNVNATDFSGQTALTYLFDFNFRENSQLEIAKLLIAAGADVNHMDRNGETPIFHTCGRSPEFIRVLKNAGANLNARDLNDETPLMSCWNLESERALIDAGADLLATTNKGRTAKELAGEHGMNDTFELLERAEKARERR